MDESEITARVLAGERDAFHVLVERHSRPLLSSLRALLADRDDAREVLQETWLRAYRHLGSLREPARMRAWLLSIALNLARARLRRPERAFEADDRLPAAPDRADPDADDERVRLRARMGELPARQREVVELRVTQELSHAEIAALLGITEEASRASFYQALKRLRDALSRPLGGRRPS